MIRETSREAFDSIKSSGLLGEMQFKVYKLIATSGPMTAMEAMNRLGVQTNQSGRFTELREMEMITAGVKVVCGITGNAAIQWRATGNTRPIKVKKEKTRTEKISLLLRYINHQKQEIETSDFPRTEAVGTLNNIKMLLGEL